MRPKVKAFLNGQNILKLLDEEYLHINRPAALEHADRIIDAEK